MVLAFVEWRSYDARFRQFIAAHGDVKCRADGSMFRREVSQADVFLQGDRRRPACDVTGFTAVDEHRIMVARDIFSSHLETHEAALHTFLFLLQQRLAPNEVLLFKLHDPSEPRL